MGRGRPGAGGCPTVGSWGAVAARSPFLPWGRCSAPCLGWGRCWCTELPGGGRCCAEPRAVPCCPSVPPCAHLAVHLPFRLSIPMAVCPSFLLPPQLLRLCPSVRPPPGGSTAPCATSWRVLSSRLILPPRTPLPPSPAALLPSPPHPYGAPPRDRTPHPPPAPTVASPLPPGGKGLTAPGW